MIEHSAEVVEIFKAFFAVQGAVDGVVKDSINPHFKNRYASLESVVDAVKEPMQANGLAFTQAPGSIVNGAIEITTMLMHVSGQWMRSTMHVPLAKVDPQGTGSAITYGCRYALMASLGLPPVDDDAQSASHDRRPAETQRASVRPAAPAAAAPADNKAMDSMALANDMIAEMRKAKSLNALDSIAKGTDWARRIGQLFPADAQRVRDDFAAQKKALTMAESVAA